MNKKLYNMMDWAGIEEIVYGESAHPEKLLGAHIHGTNTLIQAFFPGSSASSIKIAGTKTSEIKMEEVDENGYYAALVPTKDLKSYSYLVDYSTKSGKKNSAKKVTKEIFEVYKDYKFIKESDNKKFINGTLTDAYKILGSHEAKLDSVSGVYFATYAPNALRVSVIGDFNNFDARCHQMIKNDTSGIFELFIPGLTNKTSYNYEILVKGNEKIVKCDPYCTNYSDDLRESVVSSNESIKWNTYTNKAEKISIYEISLENIYSKELSLKEKALKLAKYVKEMGYTHIELMPFMEYEKNISSGYDAVSYFAVTKRNGAAKDYMNFINTMHKEGIGVIMQFPIASFSSSDSLMSFANFDGTALYEYDNPSRRIDSLTGRLLFNYSKPHVFNLIASSLNYWINVFHIDGFKFLDLASMLYLDYYKRPGTWEANVNGGNEHLEAIEFIKKINEFVHKEKKDIITIAEDLSTYSPKTNVNKNSLGFDYTINAGMHNDLIKYITLDPIERKHHQNLLTDSLQFVKDERFINAITHFDVDGIKGGMISKMPGDTEYNIKDKFANYKAMLGFAYALPGAKSMFMGQDICEFDSYAFDRTVNWDICEFENHKLFNDYVKKLNTLYSTNLCLAGNDIQFIKTTDCENNTITFVRKNEDKFLLFVLNFANCKHIKYPVGVPAKGKYKLVFSSANKEFGGDLSENQIYSSRLEECDAYDACIRINLEALSFNVYEFTPYTEAELKEMARKKAAREKKVKDRNKAFEQYKKEKIKIREELKTELKERMDKAVSKLK